MNVTNTKLWMWEGTFFGQYSIVEPKRRRIPTAWFMVCSYICGINNPGYRGDHRFLPGELIPSDHQLFYFLLFNKCT